MTNKVFFWKRRLHPCVHRCFISLCFFSMIGSAEAKEFNKNPEMQLLMFMPSQKSGVHKKCLECKRNKKRKLYGSEKAGAGPLGHLLNPNFS